MGFDQTTNIILADSVERIFSPDEPVIEEPLGVEIVRGDNIVRASSLPPPLPTSRSLPASDSARAPLTPDSSPR